MKIPDTFYDHQGNIIMRLSHFKFNKDEKNPAYTFDIWIDWEFDKLLKESSIKYNRIGDLLEVEKYGC